MLKSTEEKRRIKKAEVANSIIEAAIPMIHDRSFTQISIQEFCEKIGFGKIHVFPYSKRNNTKAALMDNHVSEEVKKDRASKLIRLSDILEAKYENKFIGKTLRIITEENHQGEGAEFIQPADCQPSRH